MMKEEHVRKRVKALRRFYVDLINFAVVNAILILIWFIFDQTGSFWPKYVMLIWGIVLGFRAFRLEIIPLIFHRTSFFNEDWEEKKVREIMHTQKKKALRSSSKDKKR